VKDLSHLNNESKAFVAFSFPNEDNIQVFIDSNDSGKEEGSFVFAPFSADKHRTLYIEPEKTFRFSREKLTAFESGLAPLGVFNKIAYQNKISKAVTKLKSTDLDKVVLSREVELDFSGDKSSSFINSLVRYPSAFVYWFFHPESGHWQGASPELFLSANDSFVETSSLAGTQVYSRDNREIYWGEKEKKEQAFVTEFIKDKLRDLTENISLKGPHNNIAGNLVHLKTEINAQLKSGVSLNKLIDALHPTPAVCGTPRDIALATISALEDYDRQYYTGYLGINTGKRAQLYVNLRCMKLEDKRATIFVGGGLTKDSNSESEYEETQAKAMTMKKVLI
jgi:isochorismate synthase